MPNDQPEPLAAVLAEMREAGRSDEHADGPLIEDYAALSAAREELRQARLALVAADAELERRNAATGENGEGGGHA